MKILLACDRSAGHVFPAFSFAQQCKNDTVVFFAPSAIFKPYLEAKGFTVLGKIVRFRNFIFEGSIRFFEAFFILKKIRPSHVIGFGGRDTFFLIVLAKFFSIDAYLYEPNCIMGKANKILSYFCVSVFSGLGEFSHPKKSIPIGIPIRKELKKKDAQEAKRALGLIDTLPVVLCFGGSQGSAFINRVFKKFVKVSCVAFQVIHITGNKQFSEISRFYDTIDRNARIFSFYENMALLYSSADLIIARAGALTLAEVSFFEKATVFVPYPGAGAHQAANAECAFEKKACRVVPQDNFSFTLFQNTIETLLFDEALRMQLGRNLGTLNIAVRPSEFYRNLILT